MSSNWPTDVINALRRNDLVVVIGAGVSINSLNSGAESPLGWKDLIIQLETVARGNAEADPVLQKLIDAGSLLEAAERVMAKAHRSGRIRDVQLKIKSLTDGGAGGGGGGNFQPNAWHDAILMLEPTIVITTNYDRLIERASKSGYQVLSYLSETVGQEVRRGEPILVKIHGSVDDLENIVLTQSDYSRMHIRGRHALDVVQALFLTRVVLFIGYSIVDPDIRLLLQNTVGGRGQIPSHYMLTPRVDEFQRQMLTDAFGIIPIEYDTNGDHSEGLAMLQELGNVPRSVVAAYE